MIKNIQKVLTLLTLVTFSSVGCSSAVTQNTFSDVSSVLENSVAGKEVTLTGNIIGKIEECHIFTDGNSNILVHFEDEDLAYNPDTMVEISGIIHDGVMPGMHHFEGEHHSDISMDKMIMVKEFQVIATSK